jgi:hypothetical protein
MNQVEPAQLPTLRRRDLLVGGATLGGLLYAMPYLSCPMMMAPHDFVPLIDAISEILLPGSLATKPGDYIASVLPNNWRGLTIDHVKLVSRWLNHSAQGSYTAAPMARRFAALSALDDGTFRPQAGRAITVDPMTLEAWTMLKRAILTAFYTSETGGSKDLAFDLVPGRWEPDIPVAQAPHPLSNDWLAVWFS